MRIEIFASGGSSVSQMQSGLDSLHSGINATIQALKKTRRKIEYLPGPASSLTSEAMGRLQDRISAEQSKMERVEKLSQDVNAFLGHTAQTDAQVSRTITQNQSKFFAENPWSKPISSGNSSAWDRFLDGWNSFWSDASDTWNGFWSSAVEGWNNFWDDAQNLWNTVKEGWEGFVRDAAEILKKALTGVIAFAKEHAVELIVGTVAIVVGAVLIALTAGAATPFLAAFGGALLAGFKAAAVSAVVGGAISTIVAAFKREDLLTAFGDGLASGYMWGGISFAFSSAISAIKYKINLKHASADKIWNHIHANNTNYPGTEIPKSFIIDTEYGSVYTNANGSKHMFGYIHGSELKDILKGKPAALNVINSRYPSLASSRYGSQLLLENYRSALSKAISNGIEYTDKTIIVDNWEFIFVKPRLQDFWTPLKKSAFDILRDPQHSGVVTVIKHAIYRP